MNDCDRLSEALSAFLDGEETAEEAVAVRAHLETCRECRATLKVWGSIDAAVTVEEPIAVRIPRRPARRAVAVLAAAAVMSLAAGGSVMAARGSRQAPAPPANRPAKAAVTVSQHPSLPLPTKRPTTPPTPKPTPTPTKTADPGAQPVVTRTSDGELLLVLALERQWFHPGETIRAGMMLRNVTKYDVTFTAPKTSPIDLVVADGAGNEVYRRSTAEGWPREGAEYTLRPGETIDVEVTFTAPAAGGYLVHAECMCLRRTAKSPEPSPLDPSDKPDRSGTSARGAFLRTPPIKIGVRP